MSQDSSRPPLLPDRRAQGDFFLCDIFDAAPKGDLASMEHPIFSISTQADLDIRRYANGSTFVEITPSVKGLATVHDRDILIYCISQCMAALNEGRQVKRTLRFRAFDLLTASNRGTHGRAYERLRDALDRLRGTTISTNIKTGGNEVLDGFGLIDRYRIVRETRDGKMQELEITLSDWVFDAIQYSEVLTLHRDYFRLRKPLERRIYEIARKHCGQKKEWKISLEKLQLKCGSKARLRRFREMVLDIVKEDEAHGHMPDYEVRFEDDMVFFYNRGSVIHPPAEPEPSIPPLRSETYESARSLAPGWDVHYLEQEWRIWIVEPPRDADRAFLGFCRKWFERRGKP
jgi:plasmid replication initiation protein